MIKRLLLLAFMASSLTGCLQDRLKSIATNEPPEINRFTHKVVIDNLDQPFQLEFDKQGHVYWIEKGGGVKRINESTGKLDNLGTLNLLDGRAPGLIGFLLDKDFEQTRHMYFYYSAADDKGDMRLSRFTLKSDNTIDMNSEILVLKVAWEQPDSGHTGGGMTWDREGNLYLSTGDGTSYSQYESIHYLDKEDSTKVYDVARSSGNTNDLRGKVLRITPQLDGSYTIPDGNLFAENTVKTRPEIYVMGNRNPWRLSIDSKTGYLHWVEVGPDAGDDSKEFGPRGYDEMEIARGPGNHGWPFVIGENRPYHQYNYETRSHENRPYELQGPVNTSPNNTGLSVLPPAQPAVVAYPYAVSEKWPVLGSGSRSAVGGPVFHRADFSDDAPRVFPDYFEDKWLVTDYVRNWIMVVSLNENRTEVVNIEPFLPWDKLNHKHPLDMDFGPTGDLYLIEYGIGGQGKISKYEYNSGNRAPFAKGTADLRSGGTPLKVQLSSKETIDYDGDDLSYKWDVRSINGDQQIQQLTKANPLLTLERAGRYLVELTVTDPEGLSSTDSFEIVAGNEQPNVNIAIIEGNKSFYFPNATFKYKVHVDDKEDGSIDDGSILPSQVNLTAEYIPSALSISQLIALQNQKVFDSETPLRYVSAQLLINKNNCFTCHQVDSELIGPPFLKIAEKYKNGLASEHNLAHSIMEGSVGKWGDIPMPPQVALSETEAIQITEYILSLAHPETEQKKLPIQGSYITKAYERVNKVVGDGDNEGRLDNAFKVPYQRGSYVLHASYIDSGNSEVGNLTLKGEDLVLLRYPVLGPESADVFSKEGISYTPGVARHPGFIVSGPKPYIGFNQIDLTGINHINISAQTRSYTWTHFIGAMFEVRLGSPDGPLVGEPYELKPPNNATVKLDVSSVEGIHDLYFIFRNDEAHLDNALVAILGIEFSPD